MVRDSFWMMVYGLLAIFFALLLLNSLKIYLFRWKVRVPIFWLSDVGSRGRTSSDSGWCTWARKMVFSLDDERCYFMSSNKQLQ